MTTLHYTAIAVGALANLAMAALGVYLFSHWSTVVSPLPTWEAIGWGVGIAVVATIGEAVGAWGVGGWAEQPNTQQDEQT